MNAARGLLANNCCIATKQGEELLVCLEELLGGGEPPAPSTKPAH